MEAHALEPEHLYRLPVELKKLRFIREALATAAGLWGKNVAELAVLEMGCGIGSIALPLAPSVREIRAFDIDPDAVGRIAGQCRKEGIANLHVTVDNAYDFGDGNRYDVVILSEVLTYLLHPEKVIRNVARHLSPGGCLILTIPNGWGPWGLKNRFSPFALARRSLLLRRIFNKPAPASGEGNDLFTRIYLRGELIRFCAANGMALINSGKSDTVLSAVSFCRRSEFWGDVDIRLADRLPYWMASGWYFLFRFGESAEDGEVRKIKNSLGRKGGEK